MSTEKPTATAETGTPAAAPVCADGDGAGASSCADAAAAARTMRSSTAAVEAKLLRAIGLRIEEDEGEEIFFRCEIWDAVSKAG
ncbi:hypothetical protein AXF42_Ash008412 [Apostasia shenzhenica]|uniref:Uncharacterized protein n=1 Tax=Apostasia shenzhenica TaxID=1088818 RepID=A0A2I0AXT1_9ASPA|nr:hypothetical protein AXF42_Ash008412 [Apostasia shenzhenica]